MKNLSHSDEKSQSFWPSQVGRYGLPHFSIRLPCYAYRPGVA